MSNNQKFILVIIFSLSLIVFTWFKIVDSSVFTSIIVGVSGAILGHSVGVNSKTNE